MSEIDQWFEADYRMSSSSGAEDHSKNWPFMMKPGENVQICILNPDSEQMRPLHYHPIYVDGQYKRVLCTAPEALGGYCPLCEYNAAQDKSKQWETALRKDFPYTILDRREGQPIRKRLRLSSYTDHRAIMLLRETAVSKMKKKGLQYLWIDLIRDEADNKAPKIGVLSQILDELDPEEFDADFLRPFTREEILSQFVHEKEEMEKIYQNFTLGGKGKAKIKSI